MTDQGRVFRTPNEWDQMSVRDTPPVHDAWLPPESLRALGSRRVLVLGDGVGVKTVVNEVTRACAQHGGSARHGAPSADKPSADEPSADEPSADELSAGGRDPVDLVLALSTSESTPVDQVTGLRDLVDQYAGAIGDEGFVLARTGAVTAVLADNPAGLLYGLFHVVRLGESVFGDDRPAELHRPVMRRRMLG